MAFIEKQLPKESLTLRKTHLAFKKDNMKLSWWLCKGEEGTAVRCQNEGAEPSVTFSDFLQLTGACLHAEKYLA